MSNSNVSRPSDKGLAGERTTLAWSRIGLSLLGIPSAILAYSASRSWLAFAAAGVAGVLGIGVLVGSLRRQRVDPEVFEAGSLAPAAAMILLAGGAVLMLTVSSVFLVLV